MNNAQLKEVAQKILELEQECQQGINVSENISSIEKLVSKFSVSDLLKLDEYISENIDF